MYNSLLAQKEDYLKGELIWGFQQYKLTFELQGKYF